MPDPKTYKGRVRATRRGYYGGMIREEGDVFDFDGVLGSWMKPTKDQPAPAAAPEPPKPMLIQDAARQFMPPKEEQAPVPMKS